MILIMKTVSRYKMGIRTSELGSFLINHLDKAVNPSGDMIGYIIKDLVSGLEQDTVKALLHRDGLSDIHTHVGRSSFDTENGFRREFYHLI